MKDQIGPTPDQEDFIFEATEYFKIGKAAEILKYTSEDLLHMGAIGKVAIMAPVVSGGIFQWPVGIDGLGFPEIDEPQKREFGLTDRVLLSIPDIAKIEAAGWVIPKCFSAPSKAQEVIDYLQTWMSEPSDQPDEILSQREVNGEVFENLTDKHLKSWKPASELMPLREIGLLAPWYAVRAFKKNTRKTTIDQLFISKKELVRLLNQRAQVSVASAQVQQVHEEIPPSTEVAIGSPTMTLAGSTSNAMPSNFNNKKKPVTRKGRRDLLSQSIDDYRTDFEKDCKPEAMWLAFTKMAIIKTPPFLSVAKDCLHFRSVQGGEQTINLKALKRRLGTLKKSEESI